MPIIKKLICIFIFLAFNQFINAQESDLFTLHPVEDLQKDFSKFRKHLEVDCPITYLYVPRKKVSTFLDSIENLIDAPMTQLEFYRIISPISSLIKDGHNLIMPSDDLVDYVINHQSIIPFIVAYINGELLVIENESDQINLPLKSKILKINGVAVQDILNRLYKVIPQEGLQTNLSDYYINRWFRFWYHLHYGWRDQYKVRFVNPDGEEKTIEIFIKPIVQQSDAEESESVINKGLYVELIDPNKKIAKLNIRSFAPEILKDRYKQKNFKKEIDACFDTIFEQGIEHLIIDIRDNGGGNPAFAAYLNQYLFDKPFAQAIEGRVMRDKDQEDVLLRSKSKWLPWYGIGTFRPNTTNYTGSIYILINGGSFSAAIEFATVHQKYQRSVFIGSESGGNPIIMAGNYLKASRKMPHTKIIYYAGILFTYYDDINLNMGRGIIPDYPVQLQLDDIISGRDKVLEATMSIIKANQ